MIFQDSAVTTGLKNKIFNSIHCQKFVFESCYSTEAKKLISLIFLAVCFGCWVCLFCEAARFLQHCYLCDFYSIKYIKYDSCKNY